MVDMKNESGRTRCPGCAREVKEHWNFCPKCRCQLKDPVEIIQYPPKQKSPAGQS